MHQKFYDEHFLGRVIMYIYMFWNDLNDRSVYERLKYQGSVGTI